MSAFTGQTDMAHAQHSLVSKIQDVVILCVDMSIEAFTTPHDNFI